MSHRGGPDHGDVTSPWLQSVPPARTVVPHAPRPPRRPPQPLPSHRAATAPGPSRREYYRRWWFRPPLGPRAELQAHRLPGCDQRRVFPARRKRTPGAREGLPCAPSYREHRLRGPEHRHRGRTLPARPSLRHLKLEAKRRLAAGEFVTLHDAQSAIAREHGLSGWARLKQACTSGSPALAHLLWVAERFSGAGRPGWTAPGEDELRLHFDDRFLAAITPATLAEQASQTGLRGFPLGDRVTDPRVKDPRHRGPSATLRTGSPRRRPGPRRAGPARPPPGGRRPRPRALGRRHRACRPGPVRAAAARLPVPGARPDRAGHRDRRLRRGRDSRPSRCCAAASATAGPTSCSRAARSPSGPSTTACAGRG